MQRKLFNCTENLGKKKHANLFVFIKQAKKKIRNGQFYSLLETSALFRFLKYSEQNVEQGNIDTNLKTWNFIESVRKHIKDVKISCLAWKIKTAHSEKPAEKRWGNCGHSRVSNTHGAREETEKSKLHIQLISFLFAKLSSYYPNHLVFSYPAQLPVCCPQKAQRSQRHSFSPTETVQHSCPPSHTCRFQTNSLQILNVFRSLDGEYNWFKVFQSINKRSQRWLKRLNNKTLPRQSPGVRLMSSIATNPLLFVSASIKIWVRKNMNKIYKCNV